MLRLCESLTVPLREQNRLLLAAGFAPAYPEHALADPPMAQVAEAIDGILTAHLPFPALVVDSGWDLVSANDAVYALLQEVPARLLEPPVNVIRLTLDPDGLAQRIANLRQWRVAHLLARLRAEYDGTHDPRLAALLAELDSGPDEPADRAQGLIVPLRRSFTVRTHWPRPCRRDRRNRGSRRSARRCVQPRHRRSPRVRCRRTQLVVESGRAQRAR